jgi:hypothetical protein
MLIVGENGKKDMSLRGQSLILALPATEADALSCISGFSNAPPIMAKGHDGHFFQ